MFLFVLYARTLAYILIIVQYNIFQIIILVLIKLLLFIKKIWYNEKEVLNVKKWQKAMLIIVSGYITYLISYRILNLLSLEKKIINSISFLMFFLPLILYILVIRKIIQNEKEEVSKSSIKIQELNKLNKKYDFKIINKNKHNILEKEFSRRSLYRVTGAGIIKYHIENNIDFIRTDIENAIYNINLLEEYTKEVNEIINYKSENNTKYSLKKFERIENNVLKNNIHNKKDFLVTVNIEVNYRSAKGQVDESRYGRYSFDELTKLYEEWKNGNKYEETKKQERKIMNDDIRYNVLKRDNFTCKLCGATARDGAKLHVDHIIPISKGGKTVMSNLQTLCDRCNLGKSNKTEDDMICPNCGGKLVERNGKYGSFIGCSNYPKCHYKRNKKTS